MPESTASHTTAHWQLTHPRDTTAANAPNKQTKSRRHNASCTSTQRTAQTSITQRTRTRLCTYRARCDKTQILTAGQRRLQPASSTTNESAGAWRPSCQHAQRCSTATVATAPALRTHLQCTHWCGTAHARRNNNRHPTHRATAQGRPMQAGCNCHTTRTQATGVDSRTAKATPMTPTTPTQDCVHSPVGAWPRDSRRDGSGLWRTEAALDGDAPACGKYTPAGVSGDVSAPSATTKDNAGDAGDAGPLAPLPDPGVVT